MKRISRVLLQDQRELKRVPVWLKIAFGFCLLVQISFHEMQPSVQAEVAHLSRAPSIQTMKFIGMGDDTPIFYGLLLWLQAFDNQPGVSIPYAKLDYKRLTEWLDLIVKLFPESRYPFFLASRVYSNVNDAQRQRIMLAFIQKKFREDPNRRWRWMAEASLIAKHRLKDLPLALQYAEDIVEYTDSKHVPYWARDMKLILLEEMNELHAAKLLIGGLLESGEITDPYELEFLESKLLELNNKTE